MNRREALFTAAAALAGTAATRALAQDGQRQNEDNGVFKTRILGSLPLETLRGFQSAPNPWVAGPSWAKLSPTGDVEIHIRGLVVGNGVTAGGTLVPASVAGTNPVRTVRIVVSWMVPVPGASVFSVTSAPMTLDPAGNLDAAFNVGTPPPGAERPVFFVRAGAAGNTPYIGNSNFAEDFGSAIPVGDD